MCQKKCGDKQECNDPGAALDLLEITTEGVNDKVRDQAECNAVGNIVGKRHHDQGQKGGDGDLEIDPINVFDGAHHQKAHVDQSRGRYGGS